MKSGTMMSCLAQNATVVQSIAIIAIAVMSVAIAGILMQVYAWQTLTLNQNS
jgi:hypothetical protein